MLQLDNRTDWAAGLFPGHDRKGQFQFTAVVKAAFTFDATGRLAPEPAEIETSDRYRGAPGQSSLAAAGETVPFKQGAELLLTGTAQPPGSGCTVMEVSVELHLQDGGDWKKTLQVLGPRRWEKRLLSVMPGKPGPLEPVPLTYENAFGGADPSDPQKIFLHNPVGKGYSEKGWRTGALELPQIEHGSSFLTAPGQKVAPAGFGPIPPTWEPRLKLFQSLDHDATSLGQAPFGQDAPADIWNAAPADQRFGQPFTGGETLRIAGLVKGGPTAGMQIILPMLRPELHLHVDGCSERLLPQCDTLLVDTDQCRIELLCRVGVPWGLTWKKEGWVLLQDPGCEKADKT